MIEIEGLNLVMTNKCNISCRHCGFSAGPDNKLVMPLAKAKEYLQEISKHPRAKLISYTGGEPFLFYHYLTELMSFASKLELHGEIVTNSFWATNFDETKEKLSILKDLGAVNFVTSLDDFHAEFIKPENIKNAVLTACELGYHVTVKTTTYPDAPYTDAKCTSAKYPDPKYPAAKFTYDYVLNFLEAEKNKIKVINQPLILSGRAKNELNTDCIKIKVNQNKAAGNCKTVLKFPTINPSGEVYPCCGFGEKCRLIGNTQETSLGELLATMQRNLFFNLLAYIGPQNILQLAAKYLKKTSPDNFLNICEACNYLVQDANVSWAVKCLLDEMVKEDPSLAHQAKVPGNLPAFLA